MKHPVRFVLACTIGGGALLWGATRYSQLKPAPVPFAFPTRELAAIDRYLQVRFAVVPDKDFGIERTYGNQHYLYDPQTPAEHSHVAALKQQKTQAAFYLMSRALWLRTWDGAGYKPIQGPVLLTGKIDSPLPRFVNFVPNFVPRDGKHETEIIDQDHAFGAATSSEDLPSHNPDGTPIPAPTTPANVPTYNALQAIGNRVFELAENAPHTAKIGVSEPINESWKVVAVPIRASNAKCLPCHVYQPLGKNPNAPKRTTVEVGDALGVAFYLYRTGEIAQTQKERALKP